MEKFEKILHSIMMIGAGFVLYYNRSDLAIIIYLVIIQDHLVSLIRKK